MKKSKFKKFLSVLLSVLILSTVVFSTNAFAVTNESDFEMNEVEIISQYGHTFLAKEISGFSDSANVEDVHTLDFGYAFTNNYNPFGDDCYLIGKNAFKDNTNIENVIFYYKKNYGSMPIKFLKIGEGAFENCTALREVKIFEYDEMSSNGYNLTEEIGSNAFKGCTSLKEFVAPFSLGRIESKAFADCTALERVFISEYATDIADDAFENCDNLTIYGENNSVIQSYAQKHNIPFVSIDKDYQLTYELYEKLLYVETMLMEEIYIRGDGYNTGYFPVETNYETYNFSDLWGDELREVSIRCAQVLKDPFATQANLVTACTEIDNAIQKAELIEEVFRLVQPEDTMHYQYVPFHHGKYCSYCEKASGCLSQYMGEYLFTVDSLARYSYLKNEVYELAQKTNVSAWDWECILFELKASIDALVFKEEVDLQKNIDFLTNYCDLSIFKPETLECFNKAFDEAKSLIKTSDENYYYETYISALSMAESNLLYAIDNLELIKQDEFQQLIYEYYDVYYSKYRDYTDTSLENLRLALISAEGSWWAPRPDYPEYGNEIRYKMEDWKLLNDYLQEKIDTLTQSYEDLVPRAIGDVSKDDQINLQDVIYSLMMIVECDNSFDYDKAYADMNADGDVTVLDVVLLQREILEMG